MMKREEMAQILATVSGARYIALIGKMGSGKTSLFNLLSGGVRSAEKSDEPVVGMCDLGHSGKVLLIDTAVLNNTTELEKQSMHRTHNIMRRADMAIYVCDIRHFDRAAYARDVKWMQRNMVPHLLVFNKCDISYAGDIAKLKVEFPQAVFLSVRTQDTLPLLRARLSEMIHQIESTERPLIPAGMVKRGDFVVLVVPDGGDAVRNQGGLMHKLLDCGARCVFVGEDELVQTIGDLPHVDLIIGYARAFDKMAEVIPQGIPLTSYSLLYGKQKGNLDTFISGAKAVHDLTEDSRVLIAEGCNHGSLHQDVGRVKIPRSLRALAGENLRIDYHVGISLPENLKDYDLVIHCGACSLTARTLQARIAMCEEAGVPIANFGTVLAETAGILDRCRKTFEDLDGNKNKSKKEKS